MTTVVEGGYCNGNRGISMSIECSGPECAGLLDRNNRLFNMACRTLTGGNITCTNSGICQNGAYRSRFTITKGDGLVSIVDRLTMVQSRNVVEVNYTTPLNITGREGAVGTGTTSASGPSATNGAPAGTTTAAPSWAVRRRPVSLKGLLLLLPLVVAMLFVGPAAATSTNKQDGTLPTLDEADDLQTVPMPLPWNSDEYTLFDPNKDLGSDSLGTSLDTFAAVPTHITSNYRLLDRQSSADVYQTLVTVAVDTAQSLATSSNGTLPAAREVFDTLAETMVGAMMPPFINIQLQYLEGNHDDAIRDTFKTVIEEAVLASVLLAGADFIVILTVHMLISYVVDQAWDELIALARSPLASLTTGTARWTPTPVPVEGCNGNDYGNSPLFHQNLTGMADQWRLCKRCCAQWGKVLFPQNAGICLCCTIKYQYDTLDNCCPDDYKAKCCRYSCGSE